MGCAPVSGHDSAFDIDKNLAVYAAVRLARNRFVIQADDIGRDGGAKALRVNILYSNIVCQYQDDGGRDGCFMQPVGFLLKPFCELSQGLDRQAESGLFVLNCCFHLSGRAFDHERYWKA